MSEFRDVKKKKKNNADGNLTLVFKCCIEICLNPQF